jgi:hypothetical protein
MPAGACTLRVEAVFRDLDEPQVQVLAAEMIDRAHQLANQPECECDVDVSVQWASPGATTDAAPQTDPALQTDVAGPADHAGRANPADPPTAEPCAER